MELATFMWERVRLVNRLPGAYALYKSIMRYRFRDGARVKIQRGPLAGLKWRHYDIYQAWMAMGLYEPHVANLIVSELQPGDVFYDVGANAGYFTLVAAKSVGPSGHVVAFDPHPRNAATVREQLLLNGFADNCCVEEVAISDRVETAEFVMSDVNANSHLVDFVAPHAHGEGTSTEVRMDKLDTFAESSPCPTLIKIDIEGAEVAALAGATKLLDLQPQPKWLVSTHSDELKNEVESVLRSHGYTLRSLEGFDQMVIAIPVTASKTE